MTNGVTFISFVNGHQPYLSRLDDPRSIRSCVYVNQNVLESVPGSRAVYSIISQDVIAGLGFPYVRRFKSGFSKRTIEFFNKPEAPYVPPTDFKLIGDPRSIETNEYICWVRPFCGKGAIMYPNALVDFYHRAIQNSNIPDWKDTIASQIGSPSGSQQSQYTPSTQSASTSFPSSQLAALYVPRQMKRVGSGDSIDSKDSSSSTAEDIGAPYQSRLAGCEALIVHLRERLEVAEWALEDCQTELRAANVENSRLSGVVQNQDDYIQDLVAAIDRMPAAPESDLLPSASSETASTSGNPGQSSPQLPPAYDSSDEEAEAARGGRDVFSFTPFYVDGILQPFVVPHQSFGANVEEAIERLGLQRGNEIHDLCFRIWREAPLNMWQAYLSGNILVGAHASEVLDAMELDVRQRVF